MLLAARNVAIVLAIGGTMLGKDIHNYRWIVIALVIGSIIGVPLGRVPMTAVPQRTALSHAFGALCVTLVGTAEYYLDPRHITPFKMTVLCAEVILIRDGDHIFEVAKGQPGGIHSARLSQSL